MDDILFSEGTQLEIDSLFGVVAEEVVEEVVTPEPEPVVEEKKSTEIDLKTYVTDDFIDLLIEHARKGELELVELKEEHGPEIVPEPPEEVKPRTLMEDYSDKLGILSKKLKTEDLVTEEDRLTSLETQLIQVRQLFREATMVSGIGQGGDGQTPGSGVVKAVDLDDVNLEGIQPGDQLVWDGGQFVPANPDDPGDEIFATKEYVDEQDALRVLKAGDTMTGNLEFKSFTAENYLKINSLRPDAYDSNLFGLEINLADGNTYKNQLRVRGRSDKEIVRLWIQDEPHIEATSVVRLKVPANMTGNSKVLDIRDENNATSFSVTADGSIWGGTNAAPFIATEDQHLVTKKFSDERLQDVQNQIDNLEASNLSTTTLNYIYTTGTVSNGQFKTSSVTPANVTSISFSARDSANRVFPALNTGDVITTRLATGTAPVQTYKVVDGSNAASVTVTAESTTANDYTDTDTYIVTIGHSFEGFATIDYVDTKVAITGDTMTGPLILSGDPGTGLQAATKDYVDNTVSNATPNLDGVILADGSVPMTGTFNSRNIDLGTNASILFSDGNQFLKINNERTLGIYGYRTDSFTSAYTRNIDVKHSLTTFGTTTKCSSNLISTRNTGYAFEVKPNDTDTVGYWHSNGTMILRPQTTSSSVAFAVYPKGLSSTNANSAFYVSGDGNVRLGTSVTIDDDLDVVSKRYVDQAIAGATPSTDYLPLTGGTVTGFTKVYVNTSQAFSVKTADFSGNTKAFEVLDRNGVTAFSVRADGRIYSGDTTAKMPTANAELAPKQYVDEQIATYSYVPGRRFHFRNSATPLSGEISYFSSAGATGGVAMRVHFNSKDGQWAVAKDDTFNNLRAMFGIYWDDNGVMKPVRTGIIYEMEWLATQSYVHCKIAQHQTNGSLSTGRNYYVTIGGLL